MLAHQKLLGCPHNPQKFYFFKVQVAIYELLNVQSQNLQSSSCLHLECSIQIRAIHEAWLSSTILRCLLGDIGIARSTEPCLGLSLWNTICGILEVSTQTWSSRFICHFSIGMQGVWCLIMNFKRGRFPQTCLEFPGYQARHQNSRISIKEKRFKDESVKLEHQIS